MGKFKKRHNEGCNCFNCRTPDDDENLPIVPPTTVLLDSKPLNKKKNSKKIIAKRNELKIRLENQLLDLAYIPVPIYYATHRFSEKLQLICSNNRRRYIRMYKLRLLKTHATSVLKIKKKDGQWTCCQNRFDRANLKKFYRNLNLSPHEIYPFVPIVLPLDCSFDSLSYCQPKHVLKSQMNQDLNLAKSTQIKEPDCYIDISSPLSIAISSENSDNENDSDIYEVNQNDDIENRAKVKVIKRKTHLKKNKPVKFVDKSSMADLNINEEKVPLTSLTSVPVSKIRKEKELCTSVPVSKVTKKKKKKLKKKVPLTSTRVIKISKEIGPSTSAPVLKTSKKRVPSTLTQVLNICKQKEPLTSVPVSKIRKEKELCTSVPVSKVTKKKKKKLKKKVPLTSTSLEKIRKETPPSTSATVSKNSKEKAPSLSAPVLKTSKKKVPSTLTQVLNICKQKEPLTSVPVSKISKEKEQCTSVPVSKVTKKKKKKLKKKVPLTSTSLEKISKETPPSTSATVSKNSKETPPSTSATVSKNSKETPPSTSATVSKNSKETPPSTSATVSKNSKEKEPFSPVAVLKLIFSKVKVPSTSAPVLTPPSEENEPIISRRVLRPRKAKVPSTAATSTPVLKNSKEKGETISKIDINKLPPCYVLLKRLKDSELQKYSKENKSIKNKRPLDPRSFVYGAELIKRARRCPLVISSNSDSDSNDDNMSFSHDRDKIECDDSEVEIIEEDESSESKINLPLIITIKEEPTEKERELKLNRIKFTDLMMGHLAYDFCPLSQGVSMLSTKLGWDLFPFGASILNKNKITREQLKNPNAGEWLQLKTQFVLSHFQEAFCIRQTTPNKYICCKNRVEFLDCKAFLNLFWNIRIR